MDQKPDSKIAQHVHFWEARLDAVAVEVDLLATREGLESLERLLLVEILLVVEVVGAHLDDSWVEDGLAALERELQALRASTDLELVVDALVQTLNLNLLSLFLMKINHHLSFLELQKIRV